MIYNTVNFDSSLCQLAAIVTVIHVIQQLWIAVPLVQLASDDVAQSTRFTGNGGQIESCGAVHQVLKEGQARVDERDAGEHKQMFHSGRDHCLQCIKHNVVCLSLANVVLCTLASAIQRQEADIRAQCRDQTLTSRQRSLNHAVLASQFDRGVLLEQKVESTRIGKQH